MKFGESLSEGLVTEWEYQYVNYKNGKKAIKKIKSLKDSVEEASNDRTPLLNNPSGVHKGTQDGNYVGSGQEQRRKQLVKSSTFSYSLKSSKDQKEEFEKEKSKFFLWLDSECMKVNNFYQEKEEQAYERFLILQDQIENLKEHRKHYHDKRANPAIASSISGDYAVYNKVNDVAVNARRAINLFSRFDLPSLPSTVFLKKFRKVKKRSISMDQYDEPYDANFDQNVIRNGRWSGDTDDEISSMTSAGSGGPRYQPRITPAELHHKKKRDYESKQYHVPYLLAKRQIKHAILEYYRGLSLLKSYKSMNRTALRKITKKYDKAIGTAISPVYIKKIDDNAYFQTSDLLDKITLNIEEVYILSFEPRNIDHKVALERLKRTAYALNQGDIRAHSFYKESFFSGIFIGFAIPLFALGLYSGLHKILDHNFPGGSSLLQIFGGFFLLNLVFLLFGINILAFEHFKINYKFIFEFNLSTSLDVRQFFLIPSFAFCFLGLVMWFSLNNYWPTEFPGRDWPWLYFGVILVIFFWPGRWFYGASRRWLQVALWRLLLSGLYPVEFRDFFLGDILCSLTYTMGNVSFFFCLYAHHWSGLIDGGKNTCGSSSSRLLGFFSTLPSIFRFLQCVRRYADTGDWFPHLANMLKYSITTLYYCLLSVYRIDRSQKNRIVFIVFATINSLYTATWDIVMDWSLLQIGAKYPLLRDNLFFDNPTYYYAGMVSDAILRFQWVFYACFSHQIQQLAVTSFCIALAEILRRFVWIFFRMENEHATNVILFRASRDSPLPYKVSSRVEQAIKKLVKYHYKTYFSDKDLVISAIESMESANESTRTEDNVSGKKKTTETPSEHITDEDTVGLDRSDRDSRSNRRTSVFNGVSNMLNKAHIKDFQRRKMVYDHDSDDEEDEEDGITPVPSINQDN